MKALCSICFTIEGLDDDDLLMLANRASEGLRNGLLAAQADLPDGVTVEDVATILDFYGATIAISQPLDVSDPREEN